MFLPKSNNLRTSPPLHHAGSTEIGTAPLNSADPVVSLWYVPLSPLIPRLLPPPILIYGAFLNRRPLDRTYVPDMSFVVRHKSTGYYLQSHRAWTSHLDSALHFNSGLRLVNYIERGGVHESP